MFTRIHALSLVIAMLTSSTLCAQPIFNYSVTAFDPGTFGLSQADFVRSFEIGAESWSSKFSDNVTMNVELQLVSGAFIAGTEVTLTNHAYNDVVAAMASDANSADDFLTVANLQSGPAGLLINRTSQNFDSATPYFDNNGSLNNSNIQLADANARALGLADPNPTGPDFTIIVANDPGGLGGFIQWDTDRSDGIGTFDLDLAGAFAHEVAHGMGFLSIVDFLDLNPGISEDGVVQTIPDMLRYSAESRAFGAGVFDMSIDDRDKYFSLDGGDTSLGLFSTGQNFGDGRQASHWKDDFITGTNLGLMDPTIDLGVIPEISELDIRMMDVLGWTIAVPEPSGGLMTGLLLLGVCASRRRTLRGR